MRRTEREITDRTLIEQVLRQADVLFLGLVDRGRAYVVPLNFGYVDGAIYLHGAKEGKKIDLLKASPRVTFTVVEGQEVVPGQSACKWSSKYRSVMGDGLATLVCDEADRRKGLTALMSKYASGPFDFDPSAFDRTEVIKIEIDKIVGKQAGY